MIMQVLETVRETESLGRSFLLWLWFKAETDEGCLIWAKVKKLNCGLMEA